MALNAIRRVSAEYLDPTTSLALQCNLRLEPLADRSMEPWSMKFAIDRSTGQTDQSSNGFIDCLFKRKSLELIQTHFDRVEHEIAASTRRATGEQALVDSLIAHTHPINRLCRFDIRVAKGHARFG